MICYSDIHILNKVTTALNLDGMLHLRIQVRDLRSHPEDSLDGRGRDPPPRGVA
jgi:hypothetical protein